ncbi:MAG: hypothetical protein Q8Q29_08320 [Actinomycetota bacterium]|nr:hypothetical protein [Actinomycetota bacterium]
MTWETYIPAGTHPLIAGEASLSKCGSITILDRDLEAAGIAGGRVVVRMDRENRRIAMRAPASRDEPSLAFSTENGKSSRSSKVHIGRVLQVMGLGLVRAVRCKLVVHGDELIVMLPLEPIEPAKVKATPIPRGSLTNRHKPSGPPPTMQQ